MNLFFRIVFTVYTIYLSVISMLTMIFTIRPDYFITVTDNVHVYILENGNWRLVVFFISLVFFALSVAFLLSGMRSGGKVKGVIRTTGIGEIRISLEALETMSMAVVKRYSGISSAKSYVSTKNDGINIFIKVIPTPEVRIPEITEDIQRKVKVHVEENAGVKVNTVKVLVENMVQAYRSRVE